uniref:Uncharacterized protein n=1 Tax=Physcomitrium patens TaxID=3218 RepID=A0A2K1JMC9_PHYPA|nr:hypothetical protein PHYPA_017545 [Physcomitrium patens]
MPDCDSSAAREISRHLQGVSRGAFQLDYGSSLLERSRTSGGIVTRPNNSNFIVNIRPSKWTDNCFYITVKNEPTARCIADAVFYYIGRPAFHFKGVNKQYPPLHVGNQDPLTSREMCKAYVLLIAKGPESFSLRYDYRGLVTDLVLKFVWNSEGVLSLTRLADTASATAACDAAAAEERVAVADKECANSKNESGCGEICEEDRKEVEDEESRGEESAPVEEDSLSEGALWMFTASASGSEWVNPALSDINSFYVPSFDINMDGLVSRVESVEQRLSDISYHVRKKEDSADEEKKREKRERRELEDNMWAEKRKKIITCHPRDLKKVIFEGYERILRHEMRIVRLCHGISFGEFKGTWTRWRLSSFIH